MIVASKKLTLENIVKEIEALKLRATANELYNLDLQSHMINDEGGFKIISNQIHYLDISGDISAVYGLFDSENNPTDTYIVKKILVSKKDDQIPLSIDRSGGSLILENQQIYYDSNGVESCRYDLFDSENNPTSSEIFSKILVV